jgi:putative hydrolase of the HAD superfamily
VISKQKPASLFRKYEDELGLTPNTINEIMFDSRPWREALIGRKSAEAFWHEIGPELGLKTSEEIDAFRHRYHSDEAINEGVLHLMRRLHGRYKLAVLSNAPSGLKRWLEAWGISELFEVVFCSGNEGIVKPDTAAYKRTLDRLGVEPDEAVFIDDTHENVEAARRLGIHAILFTTAEALEEELKSLIAF